MNRRTCVWMLAAGLLLGSGVAARGSTVSDDFNDNAIGSQWSRVTDDPSHLNLAEQNQRLEVLANAPDSASTDALYLSNGPDGFRLSTAQDFEITLDYSFASYQNAGNDGDTFGLDFGVGTDATGANSAAIGVGYSTFYNFFLNRFIVQPGITAAHRTNGAQTIDQAGIPASLPSPNTFYITYDADTDALTLSIDNNLLIFSKTLTGVVHGDWNADSLLVSFGARGSGYTTASGDAWLDNFTLVSGQVVPVPEPASLALLAVGMGGLLLRRRKLKVEG